MKYEIKKHDTLTGIASTFGTSVDEIMKANPKIQNKDLIYAGDEIEVPTNVGGAVKNTARKWWDAYVGFFERIMK